MNKQEIAELKEKLKEEFIKRKQKEKEKAVISKNNNTNNDNNYRTFDDDKYIEYFNDNIVIKTINEYNYLINKLCTLLDKEFKESCNIECQDEKPYFDIQFKEDKQNKNNILNILIEKFKDLKIDDKIKKEEDDEKNLVTIKIKLYKIANTSGEYLLKFVKKEGNRRYFIEKYNIISNIVKKII